MLFLFIAKQAQKWEMEWASNPGLEEYNMDYRSMVNPTCRTAKSTLFMLASAGNEDTV